MTTTHPTAKFRPPPPVVWLNLVCLDAPLVAVSWQWLFGCAFQIHTGSTPRLLLFLTVWGIYLADRFADTLLLGGNPEIATRHRFCRDHRTVWLIAVSAIGAAVAWLALRWLDRSMLGLGLGVAALCVAYLTANLWLGRIWRLLPIKEISIGTLFAAGTILALIPQIRNAHSFAIAAALFAALCCLNCLSIAAWERDLDTLHGKSTLLTRWPGLHPLLPTLFAGFALGTAILGWSGFVPRAITACIGVSALLLAALDLAKNIIPRDSRTSLADLVLLTPLLWLLACNGR